MLEWRRVSIRKAVRAAKGVFPFMLRPVAARMFHANQIFRDPAWRREDPDGQLIQIQTTCELGAKDGDWVAVESGGGRIVVRSWSTTAMRNGSWRLTHGYGRLTPVGRSSALEQRAADQSAHRERQPEPIAGHA